MSIVYVGIGILIGMWTKNQLNEGKSPLMTIKTSIVDLWEYTMKKIPKRKDKTIDV